MRQERIEVIRETIDNYRADGELSEDARHLLSISDELMNDVASLVRADRESRDQAEHALVVMTERVKIAKWLRTLPAETSPEWIADKLELGEIGFI